MWVLFVSGLRGAVGLALASILIQESVTAGGKEDGDDQSKKDMLSVEEELFFYVSGIVVLTLLVNGTLIGVFYNGINVYPEVQLFSSSRCIDMFSNIFPLRCFLCSFATS